MNIVIRAATLADIPALIAIHDSAFPNFFLTLLGPRFLLLLYQGFINEAAGSLDVAVDDQSVLCGLLAGARLPAEFFSALRRNRWLPLGVAMIPGLLRHPIRCLERMWSALLYNGDRPAMMADYWLISSLGVPRHHSGAGIGRRLVEHFCAEARDAGAKGVYLQTDQDHNATTLGFYANLGFVVQGAHARSDGRRLLTLKRSFSP